MHVLCMDLRKKGIKNRAEQTAIALCTPKREERAQWKEAVRD